MKHPYCEYRHLRFVVVHHAIFNKCSGTTATTYNYENKCFVWDITRPEKGTKRFSRKCEYCGKLLEIDVDSLDTITSKYEQARRWRSIGARLVPVFLVTGIVSFLLASNFQQHGWLNLVGIVCLPGFLLSLMAICGGGLHHSGYEQTSYLAELQLSPGG